MFVPRRCATAITINIIWVWSRSRARWCVLFLGCATKFTIVWGIWKARVSLDGFLLQSDQLLHNVRVQVLLIIQIILRAYLKGSGFLSHHIEALVHILRGKRTSFYVITGKTRVNPVLEHLLHAHFSTMFCHICFISNNYNRHLALFHFIITLGVHEIIPPGGDALIALDVREVEDNHTAISSSVKSVA